MIRDHFTMADARSGIFLSYASQDAEAAQRICEALRVAGIEVFFDRSELRGGDAWDHKIRKQIRECGLFLPIISKSTQARAEGYFRLEWRLADQRTHMMGRSRTFLVPVCVDNTREVDADVPDSFSQAQWTRLADGRPPPEFVDRIQSLLSSETVPVDGLAAPAAPLRVSIAASPASARRPWIAALLAIIGLVVVAIGYGALNRFVLSRGAVAAAFKPQSHSIAVLPFVNMSGDKEQDYFSDGLTEELLNALARINELQVAARTSAFSFKDKDVNAGSVARQLNVASILEGSVRRSGHTVRITAQLINGATGFHLWSETYDRDLGDVLKLQTDIANAVAGALKITLLENVTVKTELGGTHNPAAFDAYLRGLKLARLAMSTTPMDCRGPIDAFSEAIARDADYALAYANRAVITWACATNSPDWLSQQQPGQKTVRADAERAIALAPSLAEGYVALSELEQGLLQFGASDRACARARELAPGSTQVLNRCSLLAAYFGQAETAISGARHAVALDPLDPLSHRILGDTLRFARRYDEAISAYQASIAIDPGHAAEAYGLRGLSFYSAGDLPAARSSCEANPDNYRSRICLALVYHGLGREADASTVFEKLRQFAGEASAYQYAEITAQWGERQMALKWLEKALQLRDPGMTYTKTDPLLDPLREEPRFQAVLKELNFPSDPTVPRG
jgi:TolB-like protein/tetratricopeptide (TPR) repeat protein